jgi:putative transposase
MSFYPPASPCRSFQTALAPFLTDDGLPFADVLPAEQVQQACRDEGMDFGTSSRSVYTPAVTLWAFLSQVLGADRSCRAATLRVLVLVVARLPVALLRRLTLEVPDRWRWRGRHVHLVDGTLVTAPDTPANQAAWPQPPTQRPGLGFPAIRLVVLLSLTTALVGGLALAPYEGKETGETALLRSLLDRLRPGDVVLADRHYCSYFMVALLRQRDVDVVFRLHQCRDVDFRRGRRLGRDDHLVVWTRPACPEWMDPATYAVLPATLTVREMRTRVETPGLRVRELVVVTTLLDVEEYRREEVTDLYHQRWHAELDIAAIKVALRMEVLRCQTPAMVEKEIWTTMLGYNLVRKVSCQAALAAGKHPRQISFTATLQAVRQAWTSLTYGTGGARRVLGEALLAALGKEEVGDRPNRCEPRAVKRRPKNQALLMVPREQARAELLGR